MASGKEEKKHIIIGKNGKPEKYTYPRPVVTNLNTPSRDRATHGSGLQSQLQSLKPEEQRIQSEAEEYQLDSVIGIQISFESYPDIDFEFEKLADVRNGIEVLNVIEYDNKHTATILVPAGKLGTLEKKIEQYLDPSKDGKKGPRNSSLLNAIADIRKSAIENLWTDAQELYPSSLTEELWFEIWLPVLGDRQAIISDFKKIAEHLQILVSENILEFPERSVLLAKGSLNSFSSSSILLSKISEIRKAKTTAEFFDYLELNEQRDWSESLLVRTSFHSNDDTPYICILDTGVNAGHPLINPVCNEEDLFSVNPSWDAADSEGHGTAMAGLATWGDLSSVLGDSKPLEIRHRIESAKLLRYAGDNEGKHLGIITSDGVSQAEIANFDRTRVFALALSAQESRDRGKPSAWSSEIDSLASDYLGENLQRRLFMVCAGNTDGQLSDLKEYPQFNELQDIHDPGQAWNALTIGAYTRKVDIQGDDTDGYEPLAPNGGLSPHSTTSATWVASMPLKPEIVFEGGNTGIDTYSAASMPSLDLLSTHHDITTRLFSTFNATSAATALAAKFAAEIYTQYPKLWPETVRALMVHSASWTDAMLSQFDYHKKTERQKAQHLIRVVGYGVPDIKKAMWSLGNSLAMIVEDELQPFEKLKGKSTSTKDMHLHELPWPKEQLLALGETEVKMTVTLSYFIEPNPSSRNISSKYRYPSHQLRFEVKRPTESTKQFMQRLTRDAQNEEEGTTKAPRDPNWLLGDYRNKGSIHKDTWSGTAAELAERGSLAIYPAMGWWRTRTKLERFNKTARYSLVVSIDAPEVEVDLYTPIQMQVEARNKVAVDIFS